MHDSVSSMTWRRRVVRSANTQRGDVVSNFNSIGRRAGGWCRSVELVPPMRVRRRYGAIRRTARETMDWSAVEAIVEVVAWVVAVGVALRVEHLWASAIWVIARGGEFANAVHALPEGRFQTRDVTHIFEGTGGGTLPFLFVGVKSYRLEKAALSRAKRDAWRSARALHLVRFGWRYYILPLLFAPLLIAAGLTGRAETISVQMLVIAMLLVFGFIAIGVEAVFATLRMGSWTTAYHGYPKALERGTEPNLTFEVLSRFGVPVLLLSPCAYALIALVGTFFDAYPNYPNSVAGRALFVADQCTNLPGLALGQSESGVALLTKLLLISSAALYLVAVFTIWLVPRPRLAQVGSRSSHAEPDG